MGSIFIAQPPFSFTFAGGYLRFMLGREMGSYSRGETPFRMVKPHVA
jgi:hypothetical protein